MASFGRVINHMLNMTEIEKAVSEMMALQMKLALAMVAREMFNDFRNFIKV